MLAFFDWLLMPLCLFLAFPCWLLNSRYCQKTFWLSRQLHDELENEVEVISRGQESEVQAHYAAVARLREFGYRIWKP